MDSIYEIKNIDKLDSPALVVYPAIIKKNIEEAISIVKNLKDFRPHVKTTKIAEVCTMMLEAGIKKFKCATIAEAEMLATIGATDILLAYQPVGRKINRLIALTQKFEAATFSCLVDNMESAKNIADQFAHAKKFVEVFIDINTGMNRTGIKPADVLKLANFIDQLNGLKLKGLHAYDGHIRDTQFDNLKKECDKGFNEVLSLKYRLQVNRDNKIIMVMGGSPTFPVHAKRDEVESSPGTFIFWDWGYKTLFPQQHFNFAALVITRIISIVNDTTITTDLGHKSVAADSAMPRVHFLNHPGVKTISQSEEHLVAHVPDSSVFKIGDVLYGVPLHICPTVALYEKAFVIENNLAVKCWNVIARNRQINI